MVSPTASSSSSLLADFPTPLPNGGLKSYSLFDYPSSNSANALDSSWKNVRDINSPRTADNIRAIFDTPESTKPPPASSLSLVTPLSFRNGPPSSQSGLDIWSNPPQPVPLNGYVGSPPLPGLESKQQHSMVIPPKPTKTKINNIDRCMAWSKGIRLVRMDFTNLLGPNLNLTMRMLFLHHRHLLEVTIVQCIQLNPCRISCWIHRQKNQVIYPFNSIIIFIPKHHHL